MPLVAYDPSDANGVPYDPRAVITSTDSLRKQIMAAVAARLATITTANGYRTNAGNNVYEWREHAFGSDMLPAIEFRDTSDTQEQQSIGEVIHTLTVELTALATTGATVRDVIADIVEAIGTDDGWSGLADTTGLPSAPTETGQLGAQYFGAGVTFEIMYTTGRWSPSS